MKTKKITKTIVFTICFAFLCAIDWVMGSQNGRMQFVASNMTGIVMAIIIFSNYDLKSFFKPVYALWTVLCLILAPIFIQIYKNNYPYPGRIYTAALNILIYGYIVIKIFTDLYSRYKLDNSFKFIQKKVNPWIFGGWILLIVFMLISVNESIWPLWFGAMFGAFYLTDYDDNNINIIYISCIMGIILGFFVIQGIGLLFRPYDYSPRYNGMFVNPNINALFFISSHCAFLSSWYILKRTNSHRILTMISALFSCGMYGFSFMTTSKSALFTMLCVDIFFISICVMKKNRKVLRFISYWALIGIIGIASIKIDYLAARYMPTIHLHPLYFEGEYSEEKVLPGDSRNSKKYISYEQLMEFCLGRFSKIFTGFETIDFPALNTSPLVIHVQAAENNTIESISHIYPYDTYQEYLNASPFEIRKHIRQYYLSRITLFGNSNNYKGAPIWWDYYAPHAHNFLIQMAFLYGVPVGLLFILMFLAYAWEIVRLYKRGEDERACMLGVFTIAFFVFGLFEINWLVGQLPFFMFFFLFRDVVRDTTNLLSKQIL